MKKSFVAGAAAGASSLAVAVPLLAQMAGAQSSGASAPTDVLKDLPAPSQACVTALAARDASELAEIDTRMTAHKSALQARQSALSAAASITDEAQRMEAVKAAHEAFHASMESSMGTPEDRTEEMEALRAACGDAFRMLGGPMGGHGMMKGGHKLMMKFDLSEKLGMTPEELKAAIESGKTIEEVAAEKGVELPVRLEKGGMKMRFHRFMDRAPAAPSASSDGSVQ